MTDNRLKELYKNTAIDHEGEKFKVYQDTAGIPTVGIGFALLVKVKEGGRYIWIIRPEKDLKNAGIYLNTEQKRILKNHAYALDGNNKNELRNLKSQLKAMDFSIDESISNRLFDYSFKQQSGIAKNAMGQEAWSRLNDAQKVGVIDYCFQHGNINYIKEDLKGGNYKTAAEKMREDASKPSFAARAEQRAERVETGKMNPEGMYIVKGGDTFSKIAKNHGMKISELKELNPEIKDINKLQVGQKIKVVKDETSEKSSKSDNDGIAKMFEYLASAEIKNPEIDNVERFNILQKQAAAQGDDEFAEMFGNLGDSLQEVINFLDSYTLQQDDKDEL